MDVMDVDNELMEKSLNDSCQALVSGDKPQLETSRSARLFLNIFGAVGPEPVHVTMVLAVDFLTRVLNIPETHVRSYVQHL